MSFRWLPYLYNHRMSATCGGSASLDPASRYGGAGRTSSNGQTGDVGALSAGGPVEHVLLMMLVLAVGLALLTVRLEQQLDTVDRTLQEAEADLAGLQVSSRDLETRVETLRASAFRSSAPTTPLAAQSMDDTPSAETIQPQPSRKELEEIVRGAAGQYGLPFSWLAAQVAVESSWDPSNISPTSDYGLAQIHLASHRVTKEQALDPEFAADWLASTMSDYFRRYGTFREALRRYQCGEVGANYFDCGTGYAQKVLDLIPD